MLSIPHQATQNYTKNKTSSVSKLERKTKISDLGRVTHGGKQLIQEPIEIRTKIRVI